MKHDERVYLQHGVDLNTVWLTVKEDLPFLKEIIGQILTDSDA
jgi:uncharacterized protein with HEPN domain